MTAAHAMAPEVLVLGIGNLLWADDGFGVRVVEELHRRFDMAPGVRVVDGGTQGLYLLQALEGVRRLLVFDALESGAAPGTLSVLENDAIPAHLAGVKMSPHQTSFAEILGLLRLTERLPERMVLIGVEPADLSEWGRGLSPGVRACIGPAIDEALRRLDGWGYPAHRRPAPLALGEGLVGAGMAMDRYERRGGLS